MSVARFLDGGETDESENARSKGFLSKILLSKNSRRCARAAAVGKKAENIIWFLSSFLFFLSAAGGFFFFRF